MTVDFRTLMRLDTDGPWARERADAWAAGFRDGVFDEMPRALYAPMALWETGWMLSIQASAFHYSHPRVSNLPPTAYEAFEVGLLKNGSLIQKGAPAWWLAGGDVWAYAPVEAIQELFDKAERGEIPSAGADGAT